MYEYVGSRVVEYEYESENYNYYNWVINSGHYFKGCNPKIVFPQVIGLCFEILNTKEKDDIKGDGYCLRIKLDSDDTKSCVTISLIKIDGFNSDFIKTIFNALPKGLLACEIKLGPFV